MKSSSYLCLLLAILCHSKLFAQNAAENDKLLVRELRVIIAGNRPMPVFKTVGEKVIEVDPPLGKLPPTVFSFVDPKHAPKIKRADGLAKAKVDYTAWANSVVTIQKYKGPQQLQLNLSRPLLESQNSVQLVTCDLKDYLKPVIILYPHGSSQGWRNPQAMVQDLAKGDSVTVLNLCGMTVDVYFSQEKTRVPHQAVRNVRLPANETTSYRYKMLAKQGKQNVIVANSRYTIRKKTKLVAILLPGIKVRASRLPRPNLKLISLSL